MKCAATSKAFTNCWKIKDGLKTPTLLGGALTNRDRRDCRLRRGRGLRSRLCLAHRLTDRHEVELGGAVLDGAISDRSRFHHCAGEAYPARDRKREQSKPYLRRPREHRNYAQCRACPQRIERESGQAHARDDAIRDSIAAVLLVSGLDLNSRPHVRPKFSVKVVPSAVDRDSASGAREQLQGSIEQALAQRVLLVPVGQMHRTP